MREETSVRFVDESREAGFGSGYCCVGRIVELEVVPIVPQYPRAPIIASWLWQGSLEV